MSLSSGRTPLLVLVLALLAPIGVFVLTIALEAESASSRQGPPTPTDAALIDQLQQQTKGRVRISYHARTGKVRFIGTDLQHPIPQPVELAAEATPEDAAREFLVTFGTALVRYIGYWISALVLLLGFLWVLWDANKQGGHDKIAGTYVVRV